VNEVEVGAGCSNYTVVVTSDCPAPALNISPISANRVALDWTTAAGGYLLETTNSLPGTAAWQGVTNDPIVINSRFHVTNSIIGTNRFYRLHKP
jgi:hypothetical protein